jgi:hypothetical protein
MNAICDIILQFYLKGKCNFTLRIATTNPSGEERADEILTLLKPLLIDNVTIQAQVECSRFAEKPADTKILVELPSSTINHLTQYAVTRPKDDTIEDHASDILVTTLNNMNRMGDLDDY